MNVRLARTFPGAPTNYTGIDIALIAHVSERTTFGALRVGEAVNVEVDLIAKYVERIVTKR